MSDNDPTHPRAGRRDAVLRGLVAALAVVAVIWLLRAADTVFLPLAFAVFLVGLFWPLQRRLQERIPRVPAMVVTLAVFLAASAAFGWALVESISEVAERAPTYQDELRTLLQRARHHLGMSAPEGGGIEDRIAEYALSQSRRAASLVGGVILAVAYFVLGLLEVGDYGRKMDAATRGRKHRNWRGPVHDIAGDFQSYMVVRTAVGLLTGIGAGLAAWLIGLDFALLWGVLNFLLNYIPTLGSILGIFPPVLFALVQGGWPLALLALLTIGGVQLLMGAFVDPRLQGRYLRLSPLVVLLSVAFWEWVWGIPGAFIGVPLTVGLVTALARFDGTRWIAVLLSDARDGGGDRAPSPGAPAKG